MGKYELRFLPLFQEDLNAIVDYITGQLQNPNAAGRLIDDVEKGILKKENAYGLANSFLEYCHGNTVNYLLSFWIEKFLQN